jgi:hypothetical protein
LAGFTRIDLFELLLNGIINISDNFGGRENMKKAKMIAAVMALLMAGGSINYVNGSIFKNVIVADMAVTTTTASKNQTTTSTTNANTSLREISFSDSFRETYCEYFQGDVESIGYCGYTPLDFDINAKYFETIDYDFEFEDSNVIQLEKELVRIGSACYPSVKVKFPENTPIGEYTYKLIIKKPLIYTEMK